MGRIKTRPIKRITAELVERHFGEFTGKFEENKPIVKKYIDTQSKKLRNIITGYVTRIVRARSNL